MAQKSKCKTGKNVKSQEENEEEKLEDIGVMISWISTQKHRQEKKKQMELLKTQKLLYSKTNNGVKRDLKISACYLSHKGLVSRMCQKLKISTTNSQLQN